MAEQIQLTLTVRRVELYVVLRHHARFYRWGVWLNAWVGPILQGPSGNAGLHVGTLTIELGYWMRAK